MDLSSESILNQIKFICIWRKDSKSDYIVPIRNSGKNYNIVVSERSFWELVESQTAKLYLYTDISQIREKVGAGVFYKNLWLSSLGGNNRELLAT